MRVIKFRGKRVYDGLWVEGDLVTSLTPKGSMVRKPAINTTEGTIGTFFVIPQTVGQYTGLNNKNGKEIYEGDIVRTSVAKNDIGLVEWHCERAAFVVHMKSSTQWYRLDKRDQIIGNIHDNPELLKGG